MENPDGRSHVTNLQFEDGYAIVGASSKDHHIVNIHLAGGITGDDGPAAGCCVVCREPLAWVTVGSCGHRVVCTNCMIRIRHVNGDKTCCVCRAHCPTVMVTKAAGVAGTAVSGFREYWFQAKTGAYFDDLQLYQAAREACKTKLSPYYHPLHIFITLFVSSIVFGAIIGSACAKDTKHMAMKVLAYVVSISIWLTIVSFLWFTYKCNRYP